MAAIRPTPEERDIFNISIDRNLERTATFKSDQIVKFHAYYVSYFNDTEAKLPLRRSFDGKFEFADTKDLTSKEVKILNKALITLRDDDVKNGYFAYKDYRHFCNQSLKFKKGGVSNFVELMQKLSADAKISPLRILTSKQDYFTLAQVNALYQSVFCEAEDVKIGIYITDADKDNLGDVSKMAEFPYLHLKTFDMAALGQLQVLLMSRWSVFELHLYECENVLEFLKQFPDDHYIDMEKVFLHGQYDQKVEAEFQRVCKKDVEVVSSMTKGAVKR